MVIGFIDKLALGFQDLKGALPFEERGFETDTANMMNNKKKMVSPVLPTIEENKCFFDFRLSRSR